MNNIDNNNKINIFGKFISQIDDIVNVLGKLKMKKVFKTFVIILMFIFLFWTFLQTLKIEIIKNITPVMKNTIEQFYQNKTKQDSLLFSLTGEIEVEARQYTKNLINDLNGDVGTVEMLHNNIKYAGGLHKRFYDETFVSTKDGVYYDATLYQNLPTSIFPIITYIEENKYGFFTIEELKKIDAGYAYTLSESKCHHLAMMFMKTKTGEPLGILTCTWREGTGDIMPNENEIKLKMTEISSKLETLLNVTTYKNKDYLN